MQISLEELMVLLAQKEIEIFALKKQIQNLAAQLEALKPNSESKREAVQ